MIFKELANCTYQSNFAPSPIHPKGDFQLTAKKLTENAKTVMFELHFLLHTILGIWMNWALMLQILATIIMHFFCNFFYSEKKALQTCSLFGCVPSPIPKGRLKILCGKIFLDQVKCHWWIKPITPGGHL